MGRILDKKDGKEIDIFSDDDDDENENKNDPIDITTDSQSNSIHLIHSDELDLDYTEYSENAEVVENPHHEHSLMYAKTRNSEPECQF